MFYFFIFLQCSSFLYIDLSFWPVSFSFFLKNFKISFLICFIDYAITVVPIFPLCPPPPSPPIPSSNHPLCSCPWAVHISYLASSFPTLLLTSPCLFCTYQFVLLNPCTFSPMSSSPSELITLQMISISMILFLFCLFA